MMNTHALIHTGIQIAQNIGKDSTSRVQHLVMDGTNTGGTYLQVRHCQPSNLSRFFFVSFNRLKDMCE